LKRPLVRHHVDDTLWTGWRLQVLGSKRTIPFWRAKRPLLVLERALSPLRLVVGGKGPLTSPALVTVRARGRLQAASRKKGHFSEQ
jgi:hypothetical protein